MYIYIYLCICIHACSSTMGTFILWSTFTEGTKVCYAMLFYAMLSHATLSMLPYATVCIAMLSRKWARSDATNNVGPLRKRSAGKTNPWNSRKREQRGGCGPHRNSQAALEGYRRQAGKPQMPDTLRVTKRLPPRKSKKNGHFLKKF